MKKRKRFFILLLIFCLASICLGNTIINPKVSCFIDGKRVEFGSSEMVEYLTAREYRMLFASKGPRDAIMRFGERYRNEIIGIETIDKSQP